MIYASENFPSNNRKLLVDRMTKSAASELDTWRQLDSHDMLGDDFKRREEGGECDFCRGVLVADDDCCAALLPLLTSPASSRGPHVA